MSNERPTERHRGLVSAFAWLLLSGTARLGIRRLRRLRRDRHEL